MGKNGRFGRDAGKLIGKDHDGRPGWKGPGCTKKSEAKSKPKSTKTPGENNALREDEDDVTSDIPLELQQIILNTFRDTFLDVLTPVTTLQPLLQEVKAALFERDFARAFGKREYLEAYSVRWSPVRALCYHRILLDMRDHFSGVTRGDLDLKTPQGLAGGEEEDPENDQTSDKAKAPALRAICFGGGPAEVAAFGAYVRSLQDASISDEFAPTLSEEAPSLSTRKSKVGMTLIDSAGWGNVIRRLSESLSSPPSLSKYASASAKAANTSFIPAGSLHSLFLERDVFAMTAKETKDLVGGPPKLITLLFTLNELYTTSISKTTIFLLNLTMATRPGSLLLVVDSPGSYSTAKLGAEDKTYPMKFLLDHALLETDKVKAADDDRRRESPPNWVKVVSEEAKWFRTPEGLRYTIPLENMRYQLHMYRRV
ncbi:hypothetical protein BJ875DRAFT_291363 [Amylocarpus encephaloides]|uniref:25S rRNA (Uridine(2843)-N(3))-methyltransferase n=1 Tax=Amylocarpus encephaloides TaxID=45428 RepID=A0A9P7YJZ6_9HELO|nr:hypothetical protein BJ875DRAFT_291363 [Amylocarpus encephaloides]